MSHKKAQEPKIPSKGKEKKKKIIMDSDNVEETLSELTETCVAAINFTAGLIGSDINLDPKETDIKKIEAATKALKKEIKRLKFENDK
jgi:hypothetical protein